MTMATNGGEQPQAQGNAPQLNVLAQYIKDFSFENPNSPRSLAATAIFMAAAIVVVFITRHVFGG